MKQKQVALQNINPMHKGLTQISREDLLAFMERKIAEDDDFYIELKVAFPHNFPADFSLYKHKVHQIMEDNLDSSGYITYRKASSYARDMRDFLAQLDTINNADPHIVFEVCKYIISLMPELDIDDSNGTTFEVVYEACESIKKLSMT